MQKYFARQAIFVSTFAYRPRVKSLADGLPVRHAKIHLLNATRSIYLYIHTSLWRPKSFPRCLRASAQIQLLHLPALS